MNHLFKILLGLAAICLVWLCYNSVTTPIKFNDERDAREKVIAKQLSTIREAEKKYMEEKGHYAASFDTLFYFLTNEKAKIVLKEGELTDKQLEEGLTEKEAIKQGLIKRDTTYIDMMTAVYGKTINLDSLRYIPFSNPKQEFQIDTATISTANGNQVKVMECKADYDTYLGDLDHQQLVNLKETQTKLEKYCGIRFGSIEEVNNNAGNWE